MKLTDYVMTQLKLIDTMAKYEGDSLSDRLDKLIADKPIVSGTDVYKGYVLDQYECPSCGRAIGDETFVFNYCPSCGKKIEK